MAVAETDYIIGVDTGGTFTDIVLIKPNGEMLKGKSATTPADFSIGVMNAVAEIARQMGVEVRDLLGRTAYFKHGTTVATNALITKTGARVGFITTRGFEDTPLIMRAIGRVDGLPEEEVRHVTYVTKPTPLAPRELIRGVSERVDYRGEVVIPLQIRDVDEAVHDLVEVEGCNAVAVSLLHAWANPVHEHAIRDRVRELHADENVFWSFGSDLAQIAGEYARANTALANSFIGPTVQRYLTDLERKLREHGLHGPFLLMQGTGGLSGREQTHPISNLQSGPAGGMIAAAYMANLLGHSKVLTTDMGGTSFDVSLITDGFWPYAEEPIFDRYRLLQPIAEIESIGAGGGTIARVDEVTERLLVGPQSAGARPGPVCYDEGGEQVAITDTDVLLGYVDPDYFLGGRKQLNRDKAEATVRAKLSNRLELSVDEASAGVYEIINNKMSDLIRRQIVKSGHLPEDFVLYAFGGAGPVHAVGFARALGIKEIYVFPTSPVFSAFGAAMADISHSRVMTYQAVMPVDPRAFNERLETVERELMAQMASENFAADQVSFRRFVSMRFRRQTYGVELPLPWDRLDPDRIQELQRLFIQKYEDLYGEGAGFVEAGMEINTLRVDAVGPVPKPVLTQESTGRADATDALKGTRRASFNRDFAATDIYSYDGLRPGAVLSGPAIVEAELTTVVVPPGYQAAMDTYRNLILTEELAADGSRSRGTGDQTRINLTNVVSSSAARVPAS
jgi:N-methylhydantoinase A